MRFWVHQNTWGFDRGKNWFRSIKSHEIFGSIKSNEVVKNGQNLVGSIKSHECPRYTYVIYVVISQTGFNPIAWSKACFHVLKHWYVHLLKVVSIEFLYAFIHDGKTWNVKAYLPMFSDIVIYYIPSFESHSCICRHNKGSIQVLTRHHWFRFKATQSKDRLKK